jgi:hypothetical protein
MEGINMRFIVDYYKEKPKNAIEMELTCVDFRTVSSIKKAQEKYWYKDWYSGGTNHREERGMIACDTPIKEMKDVIYIEDLQELIAFKDMYGDFMITDSSYKEVPYRIEAM